MHYYMYLKKKNTTNTRFKERQWDKQAKHSGQMFSFSDAELLLPW